MRGTLVKRENQREIKIQRSFLKRNYTLSLNKKLCNGCGLCAEICPKEAIEEVPGSIIEGRLIKKPKINFKLNSCILCGECAVLCPLNAMKMKIDGEEISTVVKNEVFPSFTREILVIKENCDPECELICKEECPTNAIKISTKNTKDGKIQKITNIKIDNSLCFYCKRCEKVCPQGSINVKKPFHGTIDMDTDLCPKECRVCVDICPTNAIQMEKNKPVILIDFCIFCFACQKICPEKVISANREWIFHDDIKAAAWLTALKKLTSDKTVAKELRIKGAKKRKARTEKRARFELLEF